MLDKNGGSIAVASIIGLSWCAVPCSTGTAFPKDFSAFRSPYTRCLGKLAQQDSSVTAQAIPWCFGTSKVQALRRTVFKSWLTYKNRRIGVF